MWVYTLDHPPPPYRHHHCHNLRPLKLLLWSQKNCYIWIFFLKRNMCPICIWNVLSHWKFLLFSLDPAETIPLWFMDPILNFHLCILQKAKYIFWGFRLEILLLKEYYYFVHECLLNTKDIYNVILWSYIYIFFSSVIRCEVKLKLLCS